MPMERKIVKNELFLWRIDFCNVFQTTENDPKALLIS